MPMCDSKMNDLMMISREEYRALTREAGRRDVCWYCGGQLVWQSDFDLGDIYDSQEGIYTELTCADCGAIVSYTLREEKDE